VKELLMKMQCIIKQLLNSVFVISRITKVPVSVTNLAFGSTDNRLTSTLIILDITKTSSNYCLLNSSVFDKMYLCWVRCQTTYYVFAFVMVLNQIYVPALVYTMKVSWNFEWFVRNVWWNWLDVFLKPFLQIIQKTYLCKISTVTQKIW
jgi:hypothetical protein